MPKTKKDPVNEPFPTKLNPAPKDFKPSTGVRGQVLGRTLTDLSPDSPGMVELVTLDGLFIKESSGYFVEATTPFASKIEPGTGVVMSTEYEIEAILPNFQIGLNP